MYRVWQKHTQKIRMCREMLIKPEESSRAHPVIELETGRMCLKNNACWLYLRNIVYSMDTASRRFCFMCYCYKIVYLLRAASCAFKAAISEIIAFFSERTAAISASFSDIRESFSDIRESFSERAATASSRSFCSSSII